MAIARPKSGRISQLLAPFLTKTNSRSGKESASDWPIASEMALTIQSDVENVDWERVAEVYAKAYEGIQTAERIETVFRRSWATRLARWNGEIVGGVYAFSDGVLDASIHGLAVHPDFQRRGIGAALMKSLLEAFPPGVALLLTADEKHWDFYRRLGFRHLKTAMAIGFPEKDMESRPGRADSALRS